MKRVIRICIVMLVVLLCTSCSKNAGEAPTYFRTISPDIIAYKSGMIYKDYMDDGTVKYADFDTLNTVPICPKPNCTHTSESECSAKGINGSIIIYGEKLCWFESEMHMVDDVYTVSSQLICADPDGTNRITIARLEGVESEYVAYIKDNKIYFGARKRGYDLHGSTNYDRNFLYCYDMTSKEFTVFFSAKEGYHSHVNI